MRPARVPHPNSGPVRAAEQEVLALCSGDDPWCRFLQGYLTHAARRTAWNARLVENHLGPGGRWLDIGSFGVEALWLLRRRPDVQVSAVSYEGGDLSVQDGRIVSVRTKVNGVPRLRIDRADVEHDALPYADGSFDLVTCFECIEHLRTTPRPLLDEIRRVLRPDGQLLLTTPNVVGSRAMLRLLAGKHPQENPRYHRDPRYGIVHPKEYTLRELVALLEGRGLGVLRSRSLYFRRRTLADLAAAAVACVTRPLGGLALGLGPQGPVVGDNLLVVASPHDRPREDWPALVFEPR
ncbi:MAG: class I SAM-dependent methyltransferase [Planctomycetota bacterium]